MAVYMFLSHMIGNSCLPSGYLPVPNSQHIVTVKSAPVFIETNCYLLLGFGVEIRSGVDAPHRALILRHTSSAQSLEDCLVSIVVAVSAFGRKFPPIGYPAWEMSVVHSPPPSPPPLRTSNRRKPPIAGSELAPVSSKNVSSQKKRRGQVTASVVDVEGVDPSSKSLSPVRDLLSVKDDRKVQKLDGNAYKLWGTGTRSRSSSTDTNSDTVYCKGGPGRDKCGELVRTQDLGVLCDKCEQWYHASCQDIPKAAYEALVRFEVLSWLCPECKKSIKQGEKRMYSLESKVEQLEHCEGTHRHDYPVP